jgi:hypothetical protein
MKEGQSARGNRRGAISEGQSARGNRRGAIVLGAIGRGTIGRGAIGRGAIGRGAIGRGAIGRGAIGEKGQLARGANGEGQFLEGQTAEGQLAEWQLSEGQMAEGQLAEWQSARGNCPATSNYSDCSLRTCCCSRAATCAPMQFENLPLQPGRSHVAARVCNCIETAARERHGLSRFCFEMMCQATIVRMHMYCTSYVSNLFQMGVKM